MTTAQRMRGSSRFYTLPDGREVPSVTSILQVIAKPALVAWAANTEREHVVECAASLWCDAPEPRMSRTAFVTTLIARLGEQRAHQKKLTEAGDVGKSVHALIEWNLRKAFGQEVGPEPKLSDAGARAFACYERWAQKNRLEPMRIEQTIWSERHGYAGTLDLYALALEGVPVVVDWKTGKAIYPEARMQIAAYRQALCEMGHADSIECCGLVVRLPKQEDEEPEAALLSAYECEREFQGFLHAKALWEHLERARA